MNEYQHKLIETIQKKQVYGRLLVKSFIKTLSESIQLEQNQTQISKQFCHAIINYLLSNKTISDAIFLAKDLRQDIKSDLDNFLYDQKLFPDYIRIIGRKYFRKDWVKSLNLTQLKQLGKVIFEQTNIKSLLKNQKKSSLFIKQFYKKMIIKHVNLAFGFYQYQVQNFNHQIKQFLVKYQSIKPEMFEKISINSVKTEQLKKLFQMFIYDDSIQIWEEYLKSIGYKINSN